MIKSGAGGERRTIGLFGGEGAAGSSRVEHNDPEGVKPRRGVESRGELGEIGSYGRQRVAGTDPDHSGVNREVGRGVQRPNGSLGGSIERQRGRPGALILLRRPLKGAIAAGERKVAVRCWPRAAELAGAAPSFEA